MKKKNLRQTYLGLRRFVAGFITTALFAASMGLPHTAQAVSGIETNNHAVPSAFWQGEYFDNPTLNGTPVFRSNVRNITFNWGNGTPNRLVPNDNFSARWTRQFNFRSGVYRFRAVADDGARVWVDNTPVIDAWADGPARNLQADVVLSGLHTVRVEYYERLNLAIMRFALTYVSPPPANPPAAPQPGNEWRAEYFNNPSLEGQPALVRQDAGLNFDWGNGSPSPQVIADGFSARWTRPLNGIIAGYYNLGLRVDDGARVFVDGNLVINEWRDSTPRSVGALVYLVPGSTLRVEYYDRTGGALIQLSVFPASAPLTVPTATSVATSIANPTATPIVTYFPDWRAEYFNSIDLSGSPVLVRNDTAINFDWGNGAPDGRVNADNFSVRWTRRQNFSGGVYRIEATMDDGLRVYLDGSLVLDEWRDAPARTRTTDIAIGAGDHDLRVEFYDRGYSAVAKFGINRLSAVATLTATPAQTAVPTPTTIPATPPAPTVTAIP